MTTIAHDETCRVTGGVDTHKDTHVAAVLDQLGRLLATASFPATRHGYRRLLRWLRSFGELEAVGVEGTGSWGAGLSAPVPAFGTTVASPFNTARGLTAATPVEVNRPNRYSRGQPAPQSVRHRAGSAALAAR